MRDNLRCSVWVFLLIGGLISVLVVPMSFSPSPVESTATASPPTKIVCDGYSLKYEGKKVTAVHVVTNSTRTADSDITISVIFEDDSGTTIVSNSKAVSLSAGTRSEFTVNFTGSYSEDRFSTILIRISE